MLSTLAKHTVGKSPGGEVTLTYCVGREGGGDTHGVPFSRTKIHPVYWTYCYFESEVPVAGSAATALPSRLQFLFDMDF